MKYLYILLLTLLLSSCVKQFPSPVFDDPSSEANKFDGLKQIIRKNKKTKIVWVHGMCTTNEDFVKQRYISLRNNLLNKETENDPINSHPDPRNNGQTFTVKEKFFDRDLEVIFPIWSKMTLNAKAGLAKAFKKQDISGKLNREIKKGLINDCLADVVLYLGKAKPKIHNFVKGEVCLALNGVFNGGKCVFPPNSSTDPVIFISESLGSKILVSVLNDIKNNNGNNSNLQKQYSNVTNFFMFANQVALLELADQRLKTNNFRTESQNGSISVVSKPVEGIFEIFDNSRKSAINKSAISNETGTLESRNLSRVKIVEFTDPNDILSNKYIPQETISEGVSYAHVSVSNTGTLFSLIEDPTIAHTGYYLNEGVMDIIIDGN